jgi:uncharacterized membrane protein YfcA
MISVLFNIFIVLLVFIGLYMMQKKRSQFWKTRLKRVIRRHYTWNYIPSYLRCKFCYH